MVQVALLSALAYFISYAGNWLVGQNMADRPIVAGAIAGLLLGDLETGLIVGATLEAIFMGSVNIGGQISADHTAATVFAVAFATQGSIDPSAAMAISIPIGILVGFVTMAINNVFLSVFTPLMDKWALEGNETGLLLYLNFGVWFFKNLFFASVIFFGVYIGDAAVTSLVESIPAQLMTALTVTGQLLPAVGIGMLMKMTWSSETGIFYLLGFILYSYFNIPIIVIAILGIIIAVLNYFREVEILDIKNSDTVNKNDYSGDDKELEEFLNG